MEIDLFLLLFLHGPASVLEPNVDDLVLSSLNSENQHSGYIQQFKYPRDPYIPNSAASTLRSSREGSWVWFHNSRSFSSSPSALSRYLLSWLPLLAALPPADHESGPDNSTEIEVSVEITGAVTSTLRVRDGSLDLEAAGVDFASEVAIW